MFEVNARPHTSALPEQCTLLQSLREELGLNGPKLGCGEGECGACTVLVDGQPQTSCNLPLWDVKGKKITTLEGLGTDGLPHRLQTAFIEENAGQCGYCLSGIITRAAALLRDNPRPSREDIIAGLEKHLCRCGAHERIIRAIQKAAA
ncbi:MAG: (2Fe-2S)-binding protein [Alphaproteobacteria bacterium]|nr:(2Fe-2S)-binding protein [Alphaproteobacteria bacterium]